MADTLFGRTVPKTHSCHFASVLPVIDAAMSGLKHSSPENNGLNSYSDSTKKLPSATCNIPFYERDISIINTGFFVRKEKITRPLSLDLSD